MADLDEIYNTRILELAGAISHTERLEHADARATAHSKLCGSTVTIDLALRDGRVSDYGQSVKACLLGQASASVMAREIVGSTPDELHAVARKMRAMLKDGGPPPAGRWADLAGIFGGGSVTIPPQDLLDPSPNGFRTVLVAGSGPGNAFFDGLKVVDGPGADIRITTRVREDDASDVHTLVAACEAHVQELAERGARHVEVHSRSLA